MHPVAIRFLTPDVSTLPPEGFTKIEERLTNGLPHSITLTGDRRLLLIVPNGVPALWRDSDPAAVVSSSVDERKPKAQVLSLSIGDLSRPPALLLYQVNRTTIASAPLVAGIAQRIPQSEDPAAVEVMVLDWEIRAGTLRGPGEFGSRIVLGWRAADVGVDRFSEPPLNPVFVQRQPPNRKLVSQVGRVQMVLNRRFELTRVMTKKLL